MNSESKVTSITPDGEIAAKKIYDLDDAAIEKEAMTDSMRFALT